MRSDERSASDTVPEANDWEVLGRIAGGETAGFDGFVDRYRARLMRYVRVRVTDLHRAEDLVQGVFLRAFRAARDGRVPNDRQGRGVMPWLLVIAQHCVTDYLRLVKRKPLKLVGDAGESEGQTDGGPGPLESAARREESEQLHLMLAQLPEEQRQVIEFKVFGGLSFVEVADVLGCPVGTAKSRMRYALQHMRAMPTAEWSAQR